MPKKRWRMHIGSEDVPGFLQHLKEAKSKVLAASDVPYAKLHSKSSKTKTFYFKMSDFVGNKSALIEVIEEYNIDDEQSSDQVQSSLSFPMVALDDIVQAMESATCNIHDDQQ